MDSIENINIIASAFDRIQLRKIAPIEVDFSLENITNLRTKLKEKGYIYIRFPWKTLYFLMVFLDYQGWWRKLRRREGL